MKVGIVGLPNAGKSTLFNALTEAGAEIGSYPFTTVDPNTAVVALPDERLDVVQDATGSEAPVRATVEFVDIAGLVKGAHQGEGLGNQFLHHISEVDAILHVVRCFEDDQVSHPTGSVDPVSDIELIETELVLADLERVEKRVEELSRKAKSGDRDTQAGLEWVQALANELGSGSFASSVHVPEGLEEVDRELALLTAKPMLYVANVSEDGPADALGEALSKVSEKAEANGFAVVSVSAKIEAEIAELGEKDAGEMRKELGLGESGLDTVIHGAFDLLDLITFFTGQPGSPARAWNIPRGKKAQVAAGKIHTDMERGFIRVEVVPCDKLSEAGSIAAARDKGVLKVEGRDYIVQDGDVLTVKFSV